MLGNGKRVTLVEHDTGTHGRAEAELPETDEDLSRWITLACTNTADAYPLRVLLAGTGETVSIRMQGVIIDRHLSQAGGQG